MTMGDASSRGWGPGWPNCRAADQVTISVTGGAQFPIRKEIAELVSTLCEATVARGYAIRKPDTWGFNCRPIGGTKTASNHSWGLAVDINWQSNPHRAPLTTDMPSWMPEMWKACGFRWGGTYKKKPDTMHYEYMGTPSSVAADLEKAKTFLNGQALPAQVSTAPSPAEVGMPPYGGKVLKQGSQGDAVRIWQARMVERGWKRLDASGVFDARTTEVCRKFQTEKSLEVDGKVGRQTWTAAWSLPVT
jgi:hypothetical protein